MYRNLFWR